MTLLVGYCVGETQFVVADAAITSTAVAYQRGPQHSSFGERLRATPRGFVREAGIKLFRLAPNAIGACCGDVGAGLRALTSMKYGLRRGQQITEAMLTAQAGLHDAQLLIAAPDDTGAIRRWHVTDDQIREAYAADDIQVLGSATAEQRAFVDGAIRTITAVPRLDAHPYHALAAGIVAVQAHGQRVDLISSGIGGTFWGHGVSPGGVIPQRDIMYVLFDQRAGASSVAIDSATAVVSGQRDHIAFAWRANLRQQGLRVFVGDVTYVTDREIQEASSSMFDVQPYYLAFVQRRIGSVLMCARSRLDDDSLFSVEYGDAQLNFHLSPVIVSHLEQFPRVAAGEPLPAEVPFGVIVASLAAAGEGLAGTQGEALASGLHNPPADVQEISRGVIAVQEVPRFAR